MFYVIFSRTYLIWYSKNWLLKTELVTQCFTEMVTVNWDKNANKL